MPRLRQNIVTGEWSVVAPERAKRPEEYIRPFGSTLLHDKLCRFCHGGEVWQTHIAGAGTNHVYVVPNKYPAFAEPVTLDETGHHFYSEGWSSGAHEVIVMLNPSDTLEAMSPQRLAELLGVMQERIRHHDNDSSIEAFVPIYNQGHEAGASVVHPHAQFFGTSLVPPRLHHEFFGSTRYFQKHHSCVFCDMTTFELKDNARIIAKNEGAIAFAAYAPRFPFETWVVPTSHVSAFSHVHHKTVSSVARAMHQVLRDLNTKLSYPPLNWFVHTARHVDHHLNLSYHWHIEITPRLTTYGGYELGSDMIIDTVLPEVAARFLRD